MSTLRFTGLSPEHYARDLLHELGIIQCPTPVQQICDRLGIELIFNKSLDADAYLIRLSDRAKIIIRNRSDTYHARQRFSIAHELGHYRLPEHQDEYKCNFNDLNTYSAHSMRESEANRFAAELLMPTGHFQEDVKRCPVSLPKLMELSEKYETSLMAASLKFFLMTEDMGAVIVAKNNRVSWSKASSSFPWEINQGALLSNTYAYDLHLYGPADSERTIKRNVDINAWVATPVFDEYIELVEESLWIPSLKQTLTIIRPSDAYLKDHEYEDEQL